MFLPTHQSREITDQSLDHNSHPIMQIAASKDKSQEAIMSSQSFPRFSKLPTELTDMVWEFALPDPKCITIYSPYLGNKHGEGFDKSNAWHPRAVIVGGMSACRDSRKIFQKTHSRYEGTDDKKEIWINWDLDVICFDRILFGKLQRCYNQHVRIDKVFSQVYTYRQ
jgi:hypothetical protein